MRINKVIWFVVLVTSVILLIGYAAWGFPVFRTPHYNLNDTGNYTASRNGYYGMGMMGGWSNTENSPENVSDDTVKSDETLSLANAKINNSDNSITYTGKDIKIVVLGGPENADGKFVIGGLINPTVFVAKGSRITMEFINEDEGMPHGIEVTNAGPPYSYMQMMQGGIYPGAFINPLPAANKNGYPAATAEFTASSEGRYYYICQYPGHAQKGMYGEIIIK